MGAWFSRKRISTSDELETLTKKIAKSQDDMRKAIQSRQTMFRYMILILSILPVTAVGYSFGFMEATLDRTVLILLSLIIAVTLAYLSNYIVGACYDWRLRKKEKALEALVTKKKEILENVKETETFKVAKEILDKYDTESMTKQAAAATPAAMQNDTAMGTNQRAPQQMQPNTMLRTNQNQPPQSVNRGPMGPMGPTPARPNPGMPMQTPMNQMNRNRFPVRPFQQEPTNLLDKMVDYFFADGPNTRYALICTQCHGHNGMATPQEHDFMSYVCYICGFFNAAKKQREPVPHREAAPLPTTPVKAPISPVKFRRPLATSTPLRSATGGSSRSSSTSRRSEQMNLDDPFDNEAPDDLALEQTFEKVDSLIDDSEEDLTAEPSDKQ